MRRFLHLQDYFRGFKNRYAQIRETMAYSNNIVSNEVQRTPALTPKAELIQLDAQ